MSAVRPSPTTPGALLCPRCGNVLRPDQSWCLECGLAARTRVHPPPSWRLPVFLTCVVLALVAAGIAVGLVALAGNPSSTAAAPTTVTVPATAPAATAPTATTPSPSGPATTPTIQTTTVPTATTPAPIAPTTKVPAPRTGGAPATGAVK